MKANKKNKLLLTAIILTYISIIMSTIALATLMFNLFEIGDSVEIYLQEYMGVTEIEGMMTMYYIEMALAILINIYSVRKYSKIYKFRLNNKEAGRYIISVALWQLLFCSAIPAIFGFVAGIKMTKKKVQVETVPATPYLSDYRLNAMSEAIARLKELREKGAISEEEYYASLNKVLEG